jgi:murein tripeptide amidase MpaA
MQREPGVYHDHAQVGALLHGWAERHPLCAVESIGAAADGKDVWLLTITDAASGPHDSKPAFWCDGNMHAGEVTGCEACLHFVETLLAQWDGAEPWARDVLRASTVYVLPRISPDGAAIETGAAPPVRLTRSVLCRESPPMTVDDVWQNCCRG